MIRRHMVLDVILYVMILLVAFLVLLQNGCEWAVNERSYEPVPVITTNREPARRYFRARMPDGTIRFCWQDEEGRLHWKENRP